MKTIAFETIKGLPVSFIPDKITTVLATPSNVTQIFVTGEWSLFEVKGNYNQVMKKIREL